MPLADSFLTTYSLIATTTEIVLVTGILQFVLNSDFSTRLPTQPKTAVP